MEAEPLVLPPPAVLDGFAKSPVQRRLLLALMALRQQQLLDVERANTGSLVKVAPPAGVSVAKNRLASLLGTTDVGEPLRRLVARGWVTVQQRRGASSVYVLAELLDFNVAYISAQLREAVR